MDVFVKKYQPEKYDLWLLGMGSGLTEKRKHNLNTNTASDLSNLNSNRSRRNSNTSSNGQIDESFVSSKQSFNNYLNNLLIKYNLNNDTSSDLNVEYQNKIRNDMITNLLSINTNIVDINVNNTNYFYDLPLFLKNCFKSTANSSSSLAGLCSKIVIDLIKSNFYFKSSKMNHERNVDLNTVLGCELSDLSECLENVNENEGLVQPTNKKIQSDLGKQCEKLYNEQMMIENKNLNDYLHKTNGLWTFQSLSKDDLNKKIIKWNKHESFEYPHCSICLPFKLEKQAQQDQTIDANKLPVNSEIIIPEICFAKLNKSKTKSIDFTEYKRDSIDCLLQCKCCKVTVHQSKII